MAPSSSSSAATTSVQVALRIRPPTSQDSTSIPARFQRSVIQANSSTSITIESPSNALAGAGAPAAAAAAGAGPKKQPFNFDQVHPPPTTQYELFDSTAKPLVSRFLEGFNCTILAYGQTSSGKTFTMTGIDLDADPSDPNNRMGIIPRAVSTIFTNARQTREDRAGNWSYSVKASFIEIYNEDLIDLLSLDDPTNRREVQIREDKEGHIIWGGLREVSVKNANEVMGLLKRGSSHRQTNETDMNAQSSRSHAIFSLTLTQKKFSGSGQPPRSSSPLPPAGRSPSRLARPGSMYATGGSPAANRVASPTFNRPSTPNSFVSAMGRGGLRPSSALGHAGERSPSGAEEDRGGEWVTIVSKFHFVDLAGSERLKRTAAAGERIKEGISINSGLLALGNVISALGDPARAKSNTATHVPYRDSKLTRLLQDSLGGNAHTLMIACVSPAEWNAAETINTLKYANRARNIKNRAVLNEKEDGWDDVEWLQGTVGRLRKELKGIKEGSILPANDKEPEAVEGAGKKVLAQLTTLQNNYEDLREKFVERTEELTRLRRELGEKHRHSSSGAVNSTAKYEEIVGPVIEEYEKTISAMEAELSLNRAALRHTNEMVEEKEEELSAITERHSATELYVEELRSRVSKLTEREASTEAYVRDLEERMKTYDESSVTSTESMSDLKRELARFKDSESHSSKYIADLEGRLARSDESVLTLQQSVEKLELECEQRREQLEVLQTRLENFKSDGENWRTDLEAREVKVKELELNMLEWEQKKKEVGETRERLGEVAEEVEAAKRHLQVDISKTTSTVTSVNPSPVGEHPPPLPTVKLGEAVSSDSTAKAELEGQLLALQETHTATLADLSTVTDKYRDALREISDLAAQIQEAKLSNPSISETADESVTESPISELPQEIPTLRKRKTSPRMREGSDGGQYSPSSRRLFFRQAASTESLHARSLSQSQSLSQELSSVHSRKASFSSAPGSSHSPSSSHSLSHTMLQGLRTNTSTSMPSLSPPPSERSVVSLEKEIMRLQEVLKEREVEITLLEQVLKESPLKQDTIKPTINGVNGYAHGAGGSSERNSPTAAALSPKTLNHFETIRSTMENGHTDASSSFSDDESLERLNELMLSMAQKESQHKDAVEALDSQLVQTRRQLDELTALSRDQTLNMSMEIESLRKKHSDDLAKLEEVEEQEAKLIAEIKQLQDTYSLEKENLRAEHAAVLQAKSLEVDELVSSLKNEHSAEMSSLRAELEAAASALQKAKEDHEVAFGQLKEEHDKTLQSKLEAVNVVLEETHSAHEKAVAKIHSDHAAVLRQKEEEASASLQNTEEEYYNALTKLRADHAESIKTIASETNATVERLREEHAGELRMAEIAKEGSISESESSRNTALKTLQEEHAAAIARKDAAFSEEIESINAGFQRKSKAKDDDHALQVDRLKLEHETAVSKLKSDWRIEVEKLNATLTSESDEHSATLAKLRQEKDAAVRAVQEQQAIVLQEVERGHEEDASSIKEKYTLELNAAWTKSEQERNALAQSHTEEVLKLRTQHEELVAKLNEELVAAGDLHLQAIENFKERNKETLSSEQSHFSETLADLRKQHEAERETLKKDRDLLVQELEAHKAAAEEFTMLREQARQAQEKVLEDKDLAIATAEEQISSASAEREHLTEEVQKLREELHKTRNEQAKLVQDASKRESLVMELERHRSVLAELQENLQKSKDEKDTLQMEKSRSDALVRDLQAQLARSASPPNARSPDRNMSSYQRGSNGLPPIKLPPPTPPPSVPPPPAPRLPTAQHMTVDSNVSTSSHGSAFTSSSSKESAPESPSTSVSHTTPTPINSVGSVDPKLTVKLEQQAKLIDEQEVMIKTLNKQLMHCETDLQTHMDLVSTLENSLGDSEKNLRKARMQATELARERDTLNSRVETLRSELETSKREVATARRSVVEEKQSLEQRLDEERKAKERARQQLDSRMEELQRKKSKFACL